MGKVTNLTIGEGVDKRSQVKDQTISSFCCLVGDKILDVDGSETINTASAVKRTSQRTNKLLLEYLGRMLS